MTTKVLTVVRKPASSFDTAELDRYLEHGWDVKGTIPLGPNDFYVIVYRPE